LVMGYSLDPSKRERVRFKHQNSKINEFFDFLYFLVIIYFSHVLST
jgi:hypothetical protein